MANPRSLARLACSIALIAACVFLSGDARVPPFVSSHGREWRVVYLSYVDRDDDSRVKTDFIKFKAAVERQPGMPLASLTLEFAQASGAGPERIEALLRRVVATHPQVIVASSYAVLEAAKAATNSIPILFMSHEDPVAMGHVQSIAAPGVNRTGFTFYVPILAKSLELLRDAYPATKKVGVIIDPSFLERAKFLTEVQQATAQLALSIQLFVATNKEELAAVLRRAESNGVDAWYVPVSDVIWTDRTATAGLMASTRKPVMYNRTSLARIAGGMSYEPRIVNPFEIWARQLALILAGTDPRVIPVERPSAFELSVNVVGDNARHPPSKRILERADVILGMRD